MQDGTISRLGIVGAGAWGTALATVGARAGLEVKLWALEPEVTEAINQEHENTTYLEGVKLDETITATSDMTAMADCQALLVVTPAQALRDVAEGLTQHAGAHIPLVVCSKGIERGSGLLMSQVLAEISPYTEVLVLSGPSFAADVARGKPTAVTLAGRDSNHGKLIAEALSGPTFRPYLSGDLVGAQVGGAVKNVLAIACGIVDGKELGASARAALTTRGFAELVRFGTALGAEPETLNGLSGLGDLILTCNSSQSRNMSLGIALGEGQSTGDVLNARNSISEGAYTARIVVEMAHDLGIEMPICAAVHEIVEDITGVDEAIEQLLSRPIRAEI